MKLGSLKAEGRDGTLIVVDNLMQRAQIVSQIAPTLQAALEDWSNTRARLDSIYTKLNNGALDGFELRADQLAAPLPRAYQWLDGSAYLSHVKRVRKARGAEMPLSFLSDPLMYQGGSDAFLGARDPICAMDEAWGIDFEAEVGVVTDDVPMGVNTDDALKHITCSIFCSP